MSWCNDEKYFFSGVRGDKAGVVDGGVCSVVSGDLPGDLGGGGQVCVSHVPADGDGVHVVHGGEVDRVALIVCQKAGRISACAQ